MSTFRSVLVAALFALLPATAAGSLDATLVVTLTPVAHSGELTESGLEGEDVSLDGLDPLVVNVVMTYPFRLETPGFQVTERNLFEYTLGRDATVNLALELRGAGGRERLPVSFHDARKARNFFSLLTKYRVWKDQTDMRSGNRLWTFLHRPFLYSDRAVAEAISTVSFLNCYTFVHFLHFSDTMGFRPYFDEARWFEIPASELSFGDLARIQYAQGHEHFMMYLGRGLYLSKLGWTNDLIITDLDNIMKLYSVDRSRGPQLTAYRVRP
jgi:hypothetical protein